MAEEATPAAATLVLTVSGLSLAALFYLFQKHLAGQPLIAYEPRRRVPWNGGVALVAMSMPLLTILVFFGNLFRVEPTEQAQIDQADILAMGWGDTAFKLLFVCGMVAFVAAIFRADARDLGLPTSWRQLGRDIWLGAVATAAAFLPVFAVQVTLSFALDIRTPHPLVEQLELHQSPQMMLLAVVMAVIVAPLFEEFTFRGLLQGWLERREDEASGYVDTEREPVEEILLADDRVLGDESFAVAESTQSDVATTMAPSPQPIVSHGWPPILASAVLFGLAHLGHGVAPVSLVLFGIVLGYLYQRTHRLAPSITAHLLFNAYSMALLWLQLRGGGVD